MAPTSSTSVSVGLEARTEVLALTVEPGTVRSHDPFEIRRSPEAFGRV